MSNKKSQETWEQEVWAEVGNEYLFKEPYAGVREKILVKHNKEGCGHNYKVTPHNFLKGRRCPKCWEKNRSKLTSWTQKRWESEMKKQPDSGEYYFLGKYTHSKEPIKVRHRVCGEIMYMTPNNFLSGKRCQVCHLKSIHNKSRRTLEEFKEELRNKVKDEYVVLGEYVNNNTPIEIMHSLCGSTYKVAPGHILAGRGCPRCLESAGESRIRRWLTENEYDFKQEQTIEGCKYKRELFFDFVVKISKNRIVAIEFDGEQHYKPIKFFGGYAAFEKTVERDTIKNNFCEDNNIKLIRIPYYKYDEIPKILREAMSNVKV